MNRTEKLEKIREEFNTQNYNPMDLDLSSFGGSIFDHLWWEVNEEGKLNLFSFKGGKFILTHYLSPF